MSGRAGTGDPRGRASWYCRGGVGAHGTIEARRSHETCTGELAGETNEHGITYTLIASWDGVISHTCPIVLTGHLTAAVYFLALLASEWYRALTHEGWTSRG